jgi:hypothetical protein
VDVLVTVGELASVAAAPCPGAVPVSAVHAVNAKTDSSPVSTRFLSI